MKKIYLSLATIVMCGGAMAQNTPSVKLERAKMAPDAKVIRTNNAGTRAAGPFSRWVEPVGDVMFNKGLDLSSSNPNQDIFVAPLFQDSTVKMSSSSDRFISDCMTGSVLDPKSSYLDENLEPIASKMDSYTIDSLYIYGSYVKVTTSVDTLYTWLVWGDTTNTSVFTKRLNNQTWVAPISTWRKSVIGPKLTGAAGAAGNLVKPAAPTSNYKLIKYVLTDDDSVVSGGFIRPIVIELDAPVTIPAGNIVSCIFTFVPGGSYTNGDVAYNLNGASPQTINGFCAGVWGQTDPVLNALADYVDHQVDPEGWNMGLYYAKNQRHNASSWSGFAAGDLTSAPVIGYKISGTSTVGVNEMTENGFALNQNMPNPFSGQTTIGYTLAKNAENVSLEVFDVRGVKVFSQAQSNVKKGSYSVDVNSNGYAAGVYYYSLTVDGNKAVKKMIVK